MKKIVITGAANGIGKATARACIDAGYFVIAADRDRHGLQDLQDIVAPHRLETHLVDVSRPEVYQNFISNLYRHHSTLHGLVNNAAPCRGTSVYDCGHDEVDEIGAVNLKSLLYLSKDFALHEQQAPHTRSIINITLVAGEGGCRDALPGATQAGVIGLTKANAWNFATRVRVNAVSPALIRSPSAHDRIAEDRRMKYQPQAVLHEPFEPEGVADVIMFLLSDQSRHLTGQVIEVDRGAYPR